VQRILVTNSAKGNCKEFYEMSFKLFHVTVRVSQVVCGTEVVSDENVIIFNDSL